MLDLSEMPMIDKSTEHLAVACKECQTIRTIYDPNCLECTTSPAFFRQRNEYLGERCWFCDDCLNMYLLSPK